jgi:spermidine synthase
MEEDRGEASVYVDDSCKEWGVSLHWKDAVIAESRTTERGTVLEMIRRPQWGTACYMNGEIQSCEVDEKVYHQAFVDPLMAHVSQPRRVMIIGGGEGAMAREVLKWPSVEHVDMYEWDREVVQCFQTSYRQWANGAWDDPRLEIHYDDIFQVVKYGQYPSVPYDVILVDLFEPDGHPELWRLFSRLALDWLSENGTIGMYAGIRNHLTDCHPAEEWLQEHRIREYQQEDMGIDYILSHRDVYSYKVFIPSFSGEAMFLCLVPSHQSPAWNLLLTLSSHVTPDIWKAYHTWNRYRDGVAGVFHGV